MELHDMNLGLKKRRKRVGRGEGSGMGKTCTRGHKGQSSRTGATSRPYFEGGQIPLCRRLPKRGFKSRNRKEYHLINVRTLEDLFEANAVIDVTILKDKGLLPKSELPLKVLADGDISKSLTIKADKFSAKAKSKIEAAGGTCELIG